MGNEEPKEVSKGIIEKFLDWRQKNPDQSLILIPSTERSIILIIFTIGYFAMIFKGIEITEWYTSMLAMVIGYYFGRIKN